MSLAYLTSFSACHHLLYSSVPEWPLASSLASSFSFPSITLRHSMWRIPNLHHEFRRRLQPGRLWIMAAKPARDMELDFGKYKGKMLGTLPQNYLRWMARDLKKTGATLWAILAEEVLQDPHYHDRLEWEKLEKTLLKGGKKEGSSRNLTQESLMRAYGWDLDNRSAWGKVKLSRLGTTEGGRIPRVQASKASRDGGEGSDMPSSGNEISSNYGSMPLSPRSSKQSEAVMEEEDDVMSRRRMRRNRILSSEKVESKSDERPSLFPGRGALIRRFSQTSNSPP